MDDDALVDRVRAAAGLATHDAARLALEATFDTLADRLLASRHPPKDDEVPPALRAAIVRSRARATRPAPSTLIDFFTVVSAREGTPRSVSVAHARAVMSVLGECLERRQVEALAAWLPSDFASFLPSRLGRLGAQSHR